jgi:uncharacterized membrane protein YdjX (TVP38/TMEM64 family)
MIKFQFEEIKRKLHKLGPAILGLVILVVFGVSISLLIKSIGADKVREVVQQTGIWAPLVYILLHAITVIVSPFGGGSLLTLSAEPLFGYWWGVIYFALGAFLGAGVNFWTARLFGQQVIVNIIGEKKLVKIISLAKILTSKNPLVLVPILSTSAFNFFCYAAGLTDISFGRFFFAVFLSTVINTPIYVGVAGSVVQQNPYSWLILPALVILAIIIFVTEEILKRRSKKPLKGVLGELQEAAKIIRDIGE